MSGLRKKMLLRSTIMLGLILVYLVPTDAYRILMVLPTPTPSHYVSGARILQGLAARGHELVVISPYGSTGNWTWVPIEVDSLADAIPEFADDVLDKQLFINARNILWKHFNAYTRHVTSLPQLKHFIQHDDSHFDLVIVEEFVQSVFYIFAFKYKAPLIVLTTFGSAHYISYFMGNALELAYVPHEFIDYFGPLNFLERIGNIACTLYDLVFRNVYSISVQDALAKQVFGHLGELPSLWDLERNVSLALVNAHFSLSGVRPTLPNIVEVGGLHVEEPRPLEGELLTLLDDATEGAILFSFGSIMDLSEHPPHLVASILDALARLRHTVILKWNSGNLPTSATNLHPFPWLPQNDVLAHPNVVLFITHGGLLSGQEAVFRAVPAICIPLFGDQPRNCRRAEVLGYGLQILPKDLTAENLYDAIQRVLSDPSYKRTVQELSSRFSDRPSSALSTALYWIEYCARHKGMDFAKGPKRNLYWYQSYNVDIAVFLLIVYNIMVSLRKVLRFLKRLLSSLKRLLSSLRIKSTKKD